MLDIATLTTPLKALLEADAGIVLAGATVERSTRINFDPARAPWIGVYPGTVNSAPRAMGGRQWSDDVELQIVVQAASLSDDGTAASDELEDLLKLVYDLLNANLTLGVTGARIIKLSREYRYVLLDEDGLGNLFMPQAIVKVGLEVRSN